jgi:ATP-dependent Clp protease ATP-binding subunit ClpC
LQILDDGRITDSHGRTVDFKNTVIIMTSNLGTRDLHKKAVGFRVGDQEMNYDHMKERVTEELKKHFRPEFINRLDEIIVFHELSMDELKSIVDLMLERVRAQLANQHLDLALTDSAKEYLGTHGYDPELGARPLRRAIQRLLEDPLSERVLLGEFKAGATILVDLDTENDELRFEGIASPDIPTVEMAGQE